MQLQLTPTNIFKAEFSKPIKIVMEDSMDQDEGILFSKALLKPNRKYNSRMLLNDTADEATTANSSPDHFSSASLEQMKEIEEINNSVSLREEIFEMRALYPIKKRINPKVMLLIVEEEDCEEKFGCEKTYKCVFQTVYKNIRFMTIDKSLHRGSFFESPKKMRTIISDITAIRRGKFTTQ